jgi:hypothetical protein
MQNITVENNDCRLEQKAVDWSIRNINEEEKNMKEYLQEILNEVKFHK